MASPVNEKLLYASEQGNVEVIIEALKEGADANCVDAGMGYETPLSHAAASGSPEAVRVLLEGGANITESILAYFMAEDNDEILGLLVRANPKYAFDEFDKLDVLKGIEYEQQKTILEESGYSEALIQSDPEIKRVIREIRFAQKLKKMAKSLRGGTRRRGRGRSRQKRTYRRRAFKR